MPRTPAPEGPIIGASATKHVPSHDAILTFCGLIQAQLRHSEAKRLTVFVSSRAFGVIKALLQYAHCMRLVPRAVYPWQRIGAKTTRHL
jgi:hypothetical protein